MILHSFMPHDILVAIFGDSCALSSLFIKLFIVSPVCFEGIAVHVEP